MEIAIRKKTFRKNKGPRINNEIMASEVRLVGGNASDSDVVSLQVAKSMAAEAGLDLVEVSPNAKPPVVKLIDFGKYKYEAQKKASEAKKKQITVQLKEIQFRPNIDQHDLDVKLKKAEKFLEQGDKVKMIMQFRGRENAYKDAGLQKFKAILETTTTYGGVVESEPKFMGNRIISLVSPAKKNEN